MIDAALRKLIRRAQSPRVILKADGAFFNLPQVQKMSGRGRDNSPAVLDRAGIRWHEVDGEACARAGDIVRALEMGLLGEPPKAPYRIFQVRDVADLDALPICRDRDREKVDLAFNATTLEDHFRSACHAIRITGGACCNSVAPVPELSDGLRACAWAARDGDPRHGRVSLPEDAIPFEVCHRAGFNDVVFFRTLKWR